MTITQQIITDAYRQSNLVAVGDSPDEAQQNEGLRYLNRIVKSVFGNEAGDPLEAFPIGRKDINRPSGYPWWDGQPSNDWFVPKDTRLMLNLETSIPTIYLHPDPDNGSRFALNDVAGNLSTYPVTVAGNGRLIEGATSIVLNTDDLVREWFYREDLSSWQRYSPLEIADEFPFPEEFDDFFIILLAMRVNPSYGQTIDQQTQLAFSRSARQLKARYTQIIPTRSELGLLRMPKQAADRDVWGQYYWMYDPNAMFTKGWPY